MTIINLSAEFFDHFDKALTPYQPAELILNTTGEWDVQIPSLFHRISHFRDENYHRERLAKIAKVLEETLKQTPRDDITMNQRRPIALATRHFFKVIGKEHDCDPRISSCRKEFLAFKLALDSNILNAPLNAGFQKFASSPPLERYLVEYKHALKVDADTQEIQLLCKGVYSGWSKVKSLAVEPKLSNHDLPMQSWLYGPEGLQSVNMYDWKELKPFKKEDPSEWNHQYLFEYCCCCVDQPRMTGDHTWLRLRTPEGDVYSVGLYRPGKQSGWKSHLQSPMRVKKGYLMQPDVSEFWPTPIHSIGIAITKEQFEKMKKTIEYDKANDQQVFQISQSNCTLYVNKIAKIANIQLPTSQRIWRIITPNCLTQAIDYLSSRLPRLVVKIVEQVSTFFLNIGQYILGSTLIDNQVKKENIPCKAHFTTFWDLFKPSCAEIHHPHTIGHKISKSIKEWRDNEIKKLEEAKASASMDQVLKIQNEIERIRFDIPNEYKMK